MPKVLEYIIKGVCLIFLFWNTDVNENRAHVHVGRKVGKKASLKQWGTFKKGEKVRIIKIRKQ